MVGVTLSDVNEVRKYACERNAGCCYEKNDIAIANCTVHQLILLRCAVCVTIAFIENSYAFFSRVLLYLAWKFFRCSLKLLADFCYFKFNVIIST